jgi:hypothetical protein
MRLVTPRGLPVNPAEGEEVLLQQPLLPEVPACKK